jgi:molybdopterin molybdotransferase
MAHVKKLHDKDRPPDGGAMATLEIASSCCADHPASLSVEAARIRALDRVDAVAGDELVALGAARGRVTSSAIVAAHAVPPFDQSAMDGYAVRTRDFADGVTKFPVVARQAAGPDLRSAVSDLASAVRIFTGAVVPAGFDAVVMQEHCTRLDDAVVISRRPARGENIRPSGDDMQAGAAIVAAGTVLDARHIAILAASGVPAVRVRRRVRVGVLSTGNELREPGEPLAPGEVHDSNRAMLLSLLEGPAVDLTDLGRIADDPAAIAKAFEAAAHDFDVILSTGGVSVGEEDHVRAAVASAGGTLASLAAAIKPGKPVSVGRLGEASLIGLPGNPASALVTFLWFARPIVLRRMGLSPGEPRPVAAVAGFDETRVVGRDEFVPVVIAGRTADGRFVVERRRRAGSARLSSLLDADGLARIPGNVTLVFPGKPIDLYLLEGAFAV